MYDLYLAQYTHKYGNGYAIIGARNAEQVSSILRNQGRFRDAIIVACKKIELPTPPDGDMQLMIEGAVTTIGNSAYDIAVSLGFRGTKEEWLESMKGPKGDPGPAGSYIAGNGIDITDGVISVIESGSKVSYTPNITEGTKLGTLNIDGRNHNIYSPTPVDAYTKNETNSLLNNKQDTLTAGDNISIVDNVISASGIFDVQDGTIVPVNGQYGLNVSQHDDPAIESNAIACGQYPQNTSQDGVTNDPYHAYLSVGNGSDSTNASNAFVVTKNGNIYLKGIGDFVGTEEQSAAGLGARQTLQEAVNSKVSKFQAYNSQDAHDVHYIAKTTKVIVLDAENPTYTTQAEDQFGYGADVDSPVLEFVVNASNAKIIMPYLPELNDRQVVLAKVSKDSEYKTCAFDIVKSDSTVVHTLGLAYGEGTRDAAGNGKYKAMLFARYINEGVEQTLRVASFGDSVALTKDASSIASINFTGKTTKWQRVATIRFDQDMKSIRNDFNIKFGIYHYNSCTESTFVLQTRQKVFKEVLRTPGSANSVIEDICYKPIRVYKASGSCDAGEIWVKCRQDSRTDNIMQMHLYNIIAVPSFNPLNQNPMFNQNTSEHLMWVWENQHSDFSDYSPIGPWLDNEPTAIDSSSSNAILDCQMIPDEQEVEPIVPTTSVTLTDLAPTYTVDENSDSVISVINNCVDATGKIILNTLEDNKAVTFVVDDSSAQDLTIEDNTQSPAEATNVEIGYSAIASWNNTSEVWTVVAKSSDNTPVIEDYSNIEVNHVFHYDQIDNVSELETALQIFVTPLSGVYHEDINEGDLILMVEPVNQARLSESDCGVDAGVYVIDKVEADQNFEVSSIIISKVAGVDKLNNIVGKNSGKFTEEGYWKVINGSIRKVHRQTDEVFAAHNEQPECPGEVIAIPIIGDAEAIASIEIRDTYKTNVGVIIDCSDTVIEFSEDEWYKHEVKKLTFNTIMIDDNSGGYVLNSKYNGKTCAIKFYVKVGDREPVLRTQMILLTASNILPTINNIFNHFATVYVLNASNEQYNGYSGHEAMNVLLASYDNPVNLIDQIAPTTSIDASSGYTVTGNEDNAVNISNTSGSTQTVTLPTGASELSEAKTIIFVVANGSDDITFTDGVQSEAANAGEQVTCSWDTSEWTIVAKEYQEEESSTPSLHLDLQAHRVGSVVKSGNTYFLTVDTYTQNPSVGEYVCARQAANGAKKGIYQLTQVNPNNMIGVLITAISDISTVTVTNDTEALNGVYMAIGDEFVKVPDERELSDKQDKLVSGVNIKTVNGQSLLGSGNITISGGGGIQAASFVLYNLSGQISTVASQAYPLTLTAKFPQLGGRDWLSPNQTTGVISFTGAGVYKIEGGLGLTASSTNRVVRIKFSVLNNGVEEQGQTVNIGDTTAGGSGNNPSVVAIPSFEVLIESGWTLKIEFSTSTQSTITFDTTASSIVITKTAEIS